MNTPDFYNTVPPIIMQDMLAGFLGAAEDGILEYTYLDAVKLAGHSCPTVAGAWLMSVKALKELYPNKIPRRGEIKVEVAGALNDGVNGVIGTVAGLITGAANEGGFKGINGNFSRNDKLLYNADIGGELCFTRLDTMKSINVTYDPSSIPGNPMQMQLMQKLMMKTATPEEAKEFGRLWQDRVRRVLEAGDSLITVLA